MAVSQSYRTSHSRDRQSVTGKFSSRSPASRPDHFADCFGCPGSIASAPSLSFREASSVLRSAVPSEPSPSSSPRYSESCCLLFSVPSPRARRYLAAHPPDSLRPSSTTSLLSTSRSRIIASDFAYHGDRYHQDLDLITSLGPAHRAGPILFARRQSPHLDDVQYLA